MTSMSSGTRHCLEWQLMAVAISPCGRFFARTPSSSQVTHIEACRNLSHQAVCRLQANLSCRIRPGTLECPRLASVRTLSFENLCLTSLLRMYKDLKGYGDTGSYESLRFVTC